MKKILWIALTLAMLTTVCLPMLAQAETVVDLSNDHYYCSPGMERVGVYKDYTSKIGSGLTQDDFDITYASGSEYVTVLDETGRVMVSADAPLYNNLKLNIIYTPKVSGVGEKTTFTVRLRTNPPLEQFVPEKSEFIVAAGGRTAYDIKILGVEDYAKDVVDVSYDSEIVNVVFSDSYYNSMDHYDLSVKAAGETEVVFTAYNGQQAVVKVIGVAKPNKVEFSAEEYVCYVGETVDLGLDLGNGEYGLVAYSPYMTLACDGVTISDPVERWDYLPSGNNSFYAKTPGHYRLTASYDTYSANPLSDVAMIHVYDQGVCERIELSSGELYMDRAGIKVLCYDAQGNELILPVRITAGSDIASLDGRIISATAPGSVTITVTNPDGSTVSRTYEVQANPTEMFLNADKLTLEIGETFDVQVTFDQGSYPHTYSVSCYPTGPEFDLYSIRMEGDTIIAQAPGTAHITVKAGSFIKDIYVTVPDSDRAVHIVMPPEPFGIGHTFQMSVQDKTGKVYPATFEAGHDSVFDLTEDGWITGKRKGNAKVWVTLADGREMSCTVHVEQVPKWISYPDKIIALAQGSFSMDTVSSDVGQIRIGTEIDFSIADTTIATRSSYDIIRLHKEGTTTVTMTSKLNPNATCTFILEVIGEQTLPIMYDSLDLPYGMYYDLPAAVADEDGNEVAIEWAITYDEPGEGNPDASGFILEDGTIECVWPTASCVLTGIAKGVYEIKLFVNGYLLPQSITLEPAALTLEVGETAEVTILFGDAGAEVKEAYWAPITAGIVTCDEVTYGVKNTITAVGEGTTSLLVLLPNRVYAELVVTVVPPRVPGDADDNGSVNIYDALTILRYASGEVVTINLSNAEVTGDDQVDAHDALLIMKKGAGWNVKLK